MRAEHAVDAQRPFQQFIVECVVEHIKQVDRTYPQQVAHVVAAEQAHADSKVRKRPFVSPIAVHELGRTHGGRSAQQFSVAQHLFVKLPVGCDI